ncbi:MULTISPECIES: universal stress protein [unclassified Imperialibacter]|uniref:universal stress protein n=1 Tax=unclassified Imperialibacter TaxID=2629706 RepID=UPI001252D058|nr:MULTISPECIES: universal stress protein [unclassified Imperialibacter]CAD5292813.1 Nucleotide-binding universal stress protein, UspA family [Imperialibacter sp. 89]CAD5293858.1 Nucleotide-binding universal stress protein, UspA family [Imperialibacter sp. 75]VVT28639.1 Nucleotide-binding universal stress protein, UspA family [Imperialibacter sp. EC-SDR9]
MKKILVPTDFSKEATFALESAYPLAQKKGAEIVLVNVIEDPHDYSFNTMGIAGYSPEENIYIVQLIRKTEERLKALVADPAYAGVSMSFEVKIGKTFDKIFEVIERLNPDLVVMGSSGSSGLDEVFVGSNAEKLSRFSSVPVITVKARRDLVNIKNIVYASDLREEQGIIMNDLKALQKLYGAKLHILKVFEPVWVNDQEVKERIQKFADYYKLENYTVNTFHDPDEAEGILLFAGQNNADLIAMATHPRKGLGVLLGGMISKNVINHTQIPVWTKAIKKK